jgi:hypothetical protein
MKISITKIVCLTNQLTNLRHNIIEETTIRICARKIVIVQPLIHYITIFIIYILYKEQFILTVW